MYQKILAGGCIVFGTAIVTLGCIAVSKINKIGKKFDKGVTDIESITVKEIQDRVVEDAVRNAAEDKVGQYVYRAHKEVMDIARDEIRKEVTPAVKEAKDSIKDQVTTEITAQVANIDIDDMRKSVREKAEGQVLSKFKGDMNDILEKYSGNLQQINQIYSSVANALGKGVNGNDSSQKLTFSLGN